MTENLRGALFMVLAMACFVGNDAIMQTFADEMAWYRAIAIRGAFGVAFGILLCLTIDGARPFAVALGYARRPAVVARIAFEIAGTACFMLALFAMRLTDVNAILQTLPLFLTLGGALFFRETIGPRRLLAALAGFLGVLLIIQPGTDAFQPAAIYAVGATLFMAGRDLVTKAVPADVPSSYVALWTTVGVWLVALALSVTLPGEMPSIGSAVLGRLLAAAVLLASGFVLIVLAMRTGEVGFVAPFRYAILLMALVLDFLILGTVPGPWKWLGAGIVVAAGLYTFARERRAERNPPMASSSAAVSSASQSRNV